MPLAPCLVLHTSLPVFVEAVATVAADTSARCRALHHRQRLRLWGRRLQRSIRPRWRCGDDVWHAFGGRPALASSCVLCVRPGAWPAWRCDVRIRLESDPWTVKEDPAHVGVARLLDKRPRCQVEGV